jgi:hypothetical protein
MRIVQFYSHLNGFEYLKYHKSYIWDEFQAVVAGVDAERCKTKVSAEGKRAGTTLYSPIDMNKEFAVLFRQYGWEERRVINWLSEDTDLLRQIVTLNPEAQKETIE